MIGGNKIKRQSKGFTIVELLVVIVVIGILAIVTMVGYTGMTQRANAAALQSDLKTASTQLELYKAENGSYPSEGSGTVTGLSKSSGTTYQYSLVGGEYYLSATSTTSGPQAYYTTSVTGGTIADGVWSGHTPPPGTPLTWKDISVAEFTSHTCGIASDNNAYCWGSNSYGQLGNNSTTQSNTPVAVNTSGVLSGKTIKSIAVSNNNTCVVASDNNAYCWGLNSTGQLGNNSTTESWVPVAVDTTGVLSGKTIKQIALGTGHACAIASDNQAYCWGMGNNGRLGNNSTTQSLVPVAVTTSGALSGKTVSSMDLGLDHSCVVASDSKAYCWGYNSEYELGDGTSTQKLVPTAVSTAGVLSGKNVTSISAGSIHTCVATTENKVYCWGWNSQGQLGTNNTTNSSVPVAVDTSGSLSGKSVAAVSSGAHVTCALDTAGQAYCWGYGYYGALGNGSTNNSLVPGVVNAVLSQ